MSPNELAWRYAHRLDAIFDTFVAIQTVFITSAAWILYRGAMLSYVAAFLISWPLIYRYFKLAIFLSRRSTMYRMQGLFFWPSLLPIVGCVLAMESTEYANVGFFLCGLYPIFGLSFSRSYLNMQHWMLMGEKSSEFIEYETRGRWTINKWKLYFAITSILMIFFAQIILEFPELEYSLLRCGFWTSCIALIFVIYRCIRPIFELALEPIFCLLYSIRGQWSGAIPGGPLLVVANHASWLDPVFVTKVLPRPITPMMTSRFYKIWFLRPLLKYVFRVIVVPDQRFRHEAPELQLAIAALDRGECVVLFPEGFLRRKEEVPLRRFGQGIWQILRERPDTPVVTCWIEGGWGSFCSYFNGPPTKNKKMDFRRPIQVSVSAPEPVPAGVLEDQMGTRIHFMNRVLDAREVLGLPTLSRFELPPKGEVSEETSEAEA